jgi:3-dehydroquinate dehydratase-2
MRRSAAKMQKRHKFASKSVLVLHGPNLNLLGTREPEIYGRETLADIDRRLKAEARGRGVALESYQSNHEGALIDRIHRAKGDGVGFVIINPGGYTHTSVALRDALLAAALPFIEVHLSNVHARETFRRHSYFSDVAVGTICGLGSRGYDFALSYAMSRVSGKDRS